MNGSEMCGWKMWESEKKTAWESWYQPRPLGGGGFNLIVEGWAERKGRGIPS